jgi:hypothetical protein
LYSSGKRIFFDSKKAEEESYLMAKKIKKISRRREILIKGTHLFLRQFGQSPEVRRARKLGRRVESLLIEPKLGQMVGEKILIPTMRDWAVHVHLEALLGHYFRLSGADVMHLRCGGGLEICDRVNTWEGPPMPCHSCSKYVKTSLDAHRSLSIPLSDTWGLTNWPEIDDMNLEELRQVTYKGIPLGEIVEIPVKWFLLGETLSEDPLAMITYRKFLRSARAITDSAADQIDNYQPTQVVMLNGLFLFEAIIWELCRVREISIVTYERSFILDSFFFSRDSGAGFSLVNDVWALWNKQQLTPEEDQALDDYLRDRKLGLRTSDDYWKVVQQGGIERRKSGKRAVLFTNLVWDSAVLRQDVAFPSIVDWIVEAIEEFRKRPNDELIIRVHPAETKLSGRESREEMEVAVRKRVPEFPQNVLIIQSDDSTSSYQLMQDADFGLVYSSTTGLEMALTGKPVIVAAKTHYRGMGFTIDVNSPDEFTIAIEKLCSNPQDLLPNLELARKYAYLFFFRAPYRNLGVSEPIRGLVSISSVDPEFFLHRDNADISRLLDSMVNKSSFNPFPN